MDFALAANQQQVRDGFGYAKEYRVERYLHESLIAPHCADQPAADPELHRRESARPAEVVLKSGVRMYRVIASQRVGAKRRPMTGSTKQSRSNQQELDCFVASAPRNDELPDFTSPEGRGRIASTDAIRVRGYGRTRDRTPSPQPSPLGRGGAPRLLRGQRIAAGRIREVCPS
jgi:hypothetical protein